MAYVDSIAALVQFTAMFVPWSQFVLKVSLAAYVDVNAALVQFTELTIV